MAEPRRFPARTRGDRRTLHHVIKSVTVGVLILLSASAVVVGVYNYELTKAFCSTFRQEPRPISAVPPRFLPEGTLLCQ